MTVKTIKTVRVGDTTAILYLERYGYTYKIKARVKGYKTKQTVARSYVWHAKKEDAEARMLSDLEQITGQQRLF